jgi:uroporphyrinogen decarboxylase
MDPTTRFLNACRRLPVDRPPVWIMRQAGRYMASYQAVRKQHTFLEVCRSPDLACEVAMMPIDQLDVDAAILFSDIMVPLEPMGIGIDFNPGPILDPPVRTRKQVDALRVDGAADEVDYVYAAVRKIKDTLAGRVPLLGFAGSPFTLATYAIEGGTSRHHHELKRMVYDEPATLEALLSKIAQVITPYLRKQIEAGCDAVQLFDTWGGILNLAQWRRFSLPFAKAVMDGLADTGVPIIFYIQNGTHLWPALRELPCEVLSVDWRQSLRQVKRETEGRYAIQGNLDPGVLRASSEVIQRQVAEMIASFGPDPGLIVNLGHGITPDVTVEAAKALVDAVKEVGPRFGHGQ